MADLQLIQGEKFARTGGLKAGQLDNVGEQIGKGLEAVGKEVQEAMVKVSSWGEAEEAFNNDMQKVETDGFLAGNDIGFSEQDAASEYMTGLKQKYGDAAAKASRIENKGSAAYKNQVKIMNDVNAAAKNFAAQKDSLIASRKEYQASPGSLSVSNSFDTSSVSQMSLLSGKGQWNVDDKGNIIVDGQKMSDMGALRQKSELNSLVEQVYSDTYESSLSSGGKLTDTQVDKAGENVVASLINSGDPKANVASFAFDPLTGTQTLYSKDSEEGKKLAEDLKNWESLTNEQKNQIYNQLGEKHKSLLRAQNEKGIADYKAANASESSDMVEETYYDSDRYLDALNKKDGMKVVQIGKNLFMIREVNGKKLVSVANTSTEGKGYTPDLARQIPLLTADGKLNYEGFADLAQGKQLTRTVPATTETKTTTTDTKDDKTTTVVSEATLGGDTKTIVKKTDEENKQDKNEEEKKEEEKEIEETETATGEDDNKENGPAENNLNSDTDLFYFPEGYGEREVEQVTSKTGTTLPNMSLNKQELLEELMELDKKDLDARKLNPGDFPSESERSIVEVNQEQEDELKIKEEVVNVALGTDTKKVKDQGNKFVDLKGSLQFPLIGGKGESKVTRGFGTVKHKTLGGIKVQSNGLIFDVKKGSNAAAVSDGEVVAIQVNANGAKSVMIKHGEYTTVYSPVSELNVQKGQIIAKGQNIGKIQTTEALDKSEKTELKFQIWKDRKPQDPTEWLA
jgi:murein DD-endopeptidase MepM/ murein hydrolase activator NlpD